MEPSTHAALSALLSRFIALPEVVDGLRLGSSTAPATTDEEIEAHGGRDVPADLRTLWRCCAEAWLFRDLDYGQWGLHLLTPRASRERSRSAPDQRRGMRATDIVIGEFLGDQDLLVLDPTASEGRRLLISLPLDDREDWYAVGDDLVAFLGRLFDARGKKYWTKRPP